MASGQQRIEAGDEGLPRNAGAQPLDWVWYVLVAAWNRKLLGLAVLALGLGATYGYFRVSPRIYHVETQILTQRQQSIPTIARSSAQDDAPTRSAWELIHRRENLIALLKETGLVAAAQAPAGAAGGVPVDAGPAGSADSSSGSAPGSAPGTTPSAATAAAAGVATASVGGPREDERLNRLLLALDEKLKVTVGDGTIAISIDWPEPNQAYRLVEAALRNFLEARYLQEVTAIDEGISLLQGRVSKLRDQLDRTVEDAQHRLGRESDRQVLRLPSSPSPSPSAGSTDELLQLKSMLDAKERAISDVEEFRRRRLAELQAQLDAKRAIYSDAFPEIVNLRQDIEALSRESPQVKALREDARKLRDQYASRSTQEDQRVAGLGPRLARAVPPPQLNAAIDQDERVREARFQYQQMLERLNTAQLELDASRTAFKYRYNVIWPAELPKKPKSPNPVRTLGLGGFASVVLALVAAAGRDLASGRILMRWQVERELDLPILAQMDRE